MTSFSKASFSDPLPLWSSLKAQLFFEWLPLYCRKLHTTILRALHSDAPLCSGDFRKWNFCYHVTRGTHHHRCFALLVPCRALTADVTFFEVEAKGTMPHWREAKKRNDSWKKISGKCFTYLNINPYIRLLCSFLAVTKDSNWQAKQGVRGRESSSELSCLNLHQLAHCFNRDKDNRWQRVADCGKF